MRLKAAVLGVLLNKYMALVKAEVHEAETPNGLYSWQRELQRRVDAELQRRDAPLEQQERHLMEQAALDAKLANELARSVHLLEQLHRGG